MVQPLSPLSTSFHCSLIGSLTLLGIRVMNLLSFFSCSCRHIRYSLCYLKTPFGEWGEYIYIYKSTRGCPPQYCPPVPSFLGHTDSRYNGFVLMRSEHIAPNSRASFLGTTLKAVASLPSQQRVSVCNLYTIYWLLLFLLF